jgi:hypothetical protein
LRRNDFGAGLANLSDDGGIDEFLEFALSRASNSSTRAFNRAISAAWATTNAASSS